MGRLVHFVIATTSIHFNMYDDALYDDTATALKLKEKKKKEKEKQEEQKNLQF